jgi:spermidine synthase
MHISEEKLLFDGNTELEHYQVVDMVYEGRSARILFSGHHVAAQSGLPKDGNPEPIFDYNKRFLEIVRGIKPQRLLLIGGGAFTLPMCLLQTMPDTYIDVVELDPGLKDIAQGFFGLVANPLLKIIHADGAQYLAENTAQYDVILIDVFTRDVIPDAFMSRSFAALLRDNITEAGVVAMNIISTYRGHRSKTLQQQYDLFRQAFSRVRLYPADSTYTEWQSQNYILTATSKTADVLSNYLRFSPIDPPAGLS